MKSNAFPISYFSNTMKFKRMFLGRKKLSWLQLFFVSLFLIFLMINVVVIKSDSTPKYSLNEIMPNMMKAITDEDIEVIQTVKIENNQLVTTQPQSKKTNILILPAKSDVEALKNGLAFGKKNLELKDSNQIKFSLYYPKTFDGQKITNKQQLMTQLNDEWNSQNSVYRRLSSIFLLGLLIIISFIFFTLGTSFLIWLTQKNHLSTITTFKESLNLILNASFIPTMAAVIIGLIQYDISLMLTVQSLGLALMILMIFVKTKLNDTIAREEMSLTNTLN